MKRFTIPCVSIIFILIGCANLNKIKSESIVTVNPDGKILEEQYTEYDEAGRKVCYKVSRAEDNYYWHITHAYNKDGKISETRLYKPNGKFYSKSEVEYIEGKWIKARRYDIHNNLVGYKIPGESTEFSEISYSFNVKNELMEKFETKFDSKGRMIERLYYDSKGKVTCRQKFGHDEKSGEETMFEQITNKGSHKYLRFYDDHGNVIKKIYFEDGKLQYEVFSIYKYNSNGDILTHTLSQKGLKDVIAHYTYRDDNVKVKKSIVLYDSENKVIKKGEYKYKFYR